MEDMRNETALTKAKEIAINLIRIGTLSLEDISKATGLQISVIEELANVQLVW